MTVSFLYYAFSVVNTRGIDQGVQISELKLMLNGNITDYTNVIATQYPNMDDSLLGASPYFQSPNQAVDNNINTKWWNRIETFGFPVILTLQFQTMTDIDSYTFSTGDDETDRDPISWTLEGSNDNISWTLLDTKINYPTTTARSAYLPYFTASIDSGSIMISNVCFPAGTPITTDQGDIAIEKINLDIHTIRNKKIIDITKTVTTSDFLICFEKHSLGNNIPSIKTIMTKDHEILFGGKMRRAIDFIDNYENVHKVKYSGEPLYNVLLEKHDKMMVNNLICETLNPENPIAKVYSMLKMCKPEEQELLIKKCNQITINNNKFTAKQLKNMNKYI